MNDHKSILNGGWSMVRHNKRYIFWFWLLNLTLAAIGTMGFHAGAGAILDHSLYADRLSKGLDAGVFGELLAKPDFGRMNSMTIPAVGSAFLFFLATAFFLPGVFSGYDCNYRLPREEFFRACGRNLWRFIRIMIVAGIVMGIVAGVLFGLNSALVDKAGESTNERLSFEVQMAGLAVIFLVMTILRIWFDLAEADTVLSDQRAVRKSIAAAFRHTFRSLVRLLASYVLVSVVAGTVLLGGLWLWMKWISPANVAGAFFLSQIVLLLLLIPRFWQRGVAVSYWQQHMQIPAVPMQPWEPAPPPPVATVESVAVASTPEIVPEENPGA